MSEYVLKTQTSTFLFLVFHFEAKDTRILLLLLAFRDERNMSMLTQNILPSSFIFIQKQMTYPIPKLYPFF